MFAKYHYYTVVKSSNFHQLSRRLQIFCWGIQPFAGSFIDVAQSSNSTQLHGLQRFTEFAEILRLFCRTRLMLTLPKTLQEIRQEADLFRLRTRLNLKFLPSQGETSPMRQTAVWAGLMSHRGATGGRRLVNFELDLSRFTLYSDSECVIQTFQKNITCKA